MIVKNKLFRTFPLIIHSPQSANRPSDFFWDVVVESFFKECPKQMGPINDLTIVTWNTSATVKGILEKSLNHLGLEYRVLGQGLKNWNNLYKLSTLYEILPTISTNYILGIDCYDAIIIDHPQKIIDRFIQTNLKMCYNGTFAHQGLCSILKIEDKLYQHEKVRHLNGGVFIGYKEFIQKFLQIALEIIPTFQNVLRYSQEETIAEQFFDAPPDLLNHKNDNIWATQPSVSNATSEQGVLKIVALLFYPRVGVDAKCEMFDVIPALCKKLIINPIVPLLDARIHNKCFEPRNNPKCFDPIHNKYFESI